VLQHKAIFLPTLTSSKKEIFSAVFQDFVKFDLTLRENINISNLNKICDENTIKKVFNQINNKSMIIDKLDNGINTMLGKNIDGGTDVSEGNWQTIAIARAVFFFFFFLILDEPTASLDPIAEVEVYKQLLDASNKKTAVFITHRLGSTTSVDEIYVLDKGIIAEIGNHKNLISKGGLYAKMFNTQKQWYE
jgi:ATP-binding cassette subfamily B protein